MLRKFRLKLFKFKFRRRNKHNFVEIMNFIDLDKVRIGNYTYGFLNVQSYGNVAEKLEIGNFVSIANNVTFILGGNHNLHTSLTYPIYSKFISENPDRDAKSKGPIIISDDVWIGFGAIILSGVSIGKGAVIAAGSVVVGDLEPYGIYGGNPCKLIRYRFEDRIINELMKVDLSALSADSCICNIDSFYEPL
jgi:acetyltransferase-like isoleucine patch superfamily enzyme